MFQWRALPQFTLAGWFGYGWVRGQSDQPPPPILPGGRGQGTRRANILTAADDILAAIAFARDLLRGDVVYPLPVSARRIA
ncbi:MAG: hypothetical protein NZ482_01800 [Gloeomargarita sp. SKYG98]|nr:hypothetical protein [Gloeomargarita sp. SKYG98]